jgi:hypothetical protein
MSNKLDEGLWSADRIDTVLRGENDIKNPQDPDYKHSIYRSIKDYTEKYKNHDPKVSNVKVDRRGFHAKFSYTKNQKENKEDIWSKLGRGINKTKEVITKISDSIPRQGTLTASTGLKLGQEQAKFLKDHPDVVFGDKFKNRDGSWTIKYNAKPSKNKSSQDRINNIQKALNKLSDDKLNSIESIIKEK